MFKLHTEANTYCHHLEFGQYLLHDDIKFIELKQTVIGKCLVLDFRLCQLESLYYWNTSYDLKRIVEGLRTFLIGICKDSIASLPNCLMG